MSLEVSYTTTLDDYVEFSLHSMKRSPSMKRRFVRAWILLPIGCILWAAIVARVYPLAAVGLAIFGVAYAVVYPILYRASIRQSVRAFAQDLGARGVIGHITLVFTEESLTEQTETGCSVARWCDMKGVEVVGEYTFIYVNGLAAAIVPRHGFERAQDYEAVQNFAIAKLGKPS